MNNALNLKFKQAKYLETEPALAAKITAVETIDEGVRATHQSGGENLPLAHVCPEPVLANPPLYIKPNILPRQARDKHRKKLKNRPFERLALAVPEPLT
eukprot:COSAG06_NODE_1465_length_9371_cov_8.861842_2_plen_99_part_00